ncbi:MAG: HDOD domain-containing protein [Candidatus Aureabacteria bacterium]|nr:HDOD domain-containing protein [Candidatus Auribacterota bacterium]
MKNIIDRSKLQEFIESLHSISTIPAVMSKTLQIIDNPQSSASEISSIIEKDYALTMKILKIVNSVFYGYEEKVTSIHTAVVALGLKTLRSMTLGLSFVDYLKQGFENILDIEKFWEHSIGTAVIASMVVEQRYPKLREDVFVGGLLHDIGKVVLLQFLVREYKKALEKSKDDDIPLYLCEQELLGIDHGEVGGLLARKWHLSDELISAITMHHSKDCFRMNPEAKETVFACAVNCANLIALEKEIGASGDAYRTPIPEELLEFLKLKPADIVEIFKKSNKRVQKVKKELVLE